LAEYVVKPLQSEGIMRALLIHNPKAGDRKRSKRQLIAIPTRCGHQVLYQSTKKRGWKKALKKPVDLMIAAGGMARYRKLRGDIIGSGARG
jgi:diacylglycerol kinase (ATP)